MKVLKTKKFKVISSFLNGVIYFFIAYEGLENIKFKSCFFYFIKSNSAFFALLACLIYSTFMYKTLESFSYKLNTVTKLIFTLLAPVSTLAFFSSGFFGAIKFGVYDKLAFQIGFILFLFRMINALDAADKFPSRFSNFIIAQSVAIKEKKTIELIRILVVWFCSIGYCFCALDSIHWSSLVILKSLNFIPTAYVNILSIFFANLGSIGTFPLIFYWSYRGLKQLTFARSDLYYSDTTDIYTFIALFLVSPIILGIIGGVSSVDNGLLGKQGDFSYYLRITTSVMYGCFAGTPGLANLLRSLNKFYTFQHDL